MKFNELVAPNFKRNAVLMIVLAICAYLAFASTLDHGFHNVDDHDYVVVNADIRQLNLDNLTKWFTRDYVLMYIPITMISFALDYYFWGQEPFGYHLTNILFHTANVLLVYLLLIRLKPHWLIAFVTTLLFAFHPVQIESVAWVSERKNLLAAFFCLLTFHQYLSRRCFLTLLFFLLALLSKPSMVVIPMLLIWHQWCFGLSWGRLKQYGLLVMMVGVSLLIGIYMVAINQATEVILRGGSSWTNFLTSLTVYYRYGELLLFPFKQQMWHMTELYSSVWRMPVLFSMLGLVLIFLTLIFMRKREPTACFLGAWFFIHLVPNSHVIVAVQSFMQDRYLYLPMVGFYWVCFYLLFRFTKGLLFPEKINRMVPIVLTGFVCLLIAIPIAIRQQQRLKMWGDPIILWEADVLKAKYHDRRLYEGLASAYTMAGKIDAGIHATESAMKYNPTTETKFRQLQNFLFAGDAEQAFEILRDVEETYNQMTPLYKSLFNDLYGFYYKIIGQGDLALAYYQKAAQFNQSVTPFVHVSDMHYDRGERREAIEWLEKALPVDPDAPYVLKRLCSWYIELGEFEKAYPHYQKLARIAPQDEYVAFISRNIKRQITKQSGTN